MKKILFLFCITLLSNQLFGLVPDAGLQKLIDDHKKVFGELEKYAGDIEAQVDYQYVGNGHTIITYTYVFKSNEAKKVFDKYKRALDSLTMRLALTGMVDGASIGAIVSVASKIFGNKFFDERALAASIILAGSASVYDNSTREELPYFNKAMYKHNDLFATISFDGVGRILINGFSSLCGFALTELVVALLTKDGSGRMHR